MRQTIIMLLFLISNSVIAQSRLISWGMNDVKNLTEDVFNEARNINPTLWVDKSKNATTWLEVFLSINNVIEHKSDKELMLSFAKQITDTTTTQLKDTSRLIIWDRIISKEIVFEGKGIVIENDLFTVAGRANQILQSALGKNYGYISIDTDFKTLQQLQQKWIKTIEGEDIDQWEKPKISNDNVIEEISNLKAFEAIIISIQPSAKKDVITATCLKNIYDLDEMPENPGSAAYCNPDSYSLGYLRILTGEKTIDPNKDYKYWEEFWNKNKEILIWDDTKGYFVIN